MMTTTITATLLLLLAPSDALPSCRSGSAQSNLTCWTSFGQNKMACAREANAGYLSVTTVLVVPSRVSAEGGCAYPGDQKNSTTIYPQGTYDLPKLIRTEMTYCHSDLCNVLSKDMETIQCTVTFAVP